MIWTGPEQRSKSQEHTTLFLTSGFTIPLTNRVVFVLTLSFSLHNRRERLWTAPARQGVGLCSESWGRSISVWIRKTVHPWPEGAWGEWWNCEICERRPSSDTLVLYWASKGFKDSNLKAKKIAMCVWRKPSSVIINLSFHALVPCPDPKPPDIIITHYIQHLVAKTEKWGYSHSYLKQGLLELTPLVD